MAVQKIDNFNIHENPETNQNQFDIKNYLNANWNKTKNVVNNNADELTSLQKDNTTNKTDITNIKAEQIEQNTELEELRAENERLREDINGLPSGQAQGESIDLTDSADMRFKSFEVSGNSRQDTRSGNLYNNTKNKLGHYLDVDGNMVASTGWNITDYIPVIAEETYYIEGNKNLTEGVNVYGAYYNSNKELISTFPYSDYRDEQTTLNMPADVGYVRFSVYKHADNTATFDFYTDSPTPDYPSEIKSCGDNVSLFDGELEDGAYNTTTGEKASYANNVRNVNPIQVEPNDYYIISNDGVGIAMNVVQYTSNMTFIKGETISADSVLSTESTTKYINISRGNTNVDKIKIEKGKKISPYSPYGQGCINEVICNKNYFNINYSGTSRGITYNLSKNKITLNGTSSGMGDVFNTKNYSTFFLKAGTYIINAKVISGSFATETNDMAIYFRTKSDDKNFVNLYKSVNYTAKGTITFTEDDEIYVYAFVNGSNVIFNNLIIEIQLEEGNEATEIVAHQSQTFTIPTQQPMLEDDCFDWENEEEVHTWGKKIPTSSLNWNVSTTRAGRFFTDTNYIPGDGYDGTLKGIKCKYFKEYTTNDISKVYTNKEGMDINGQSRLSLNFTDITTVDELKEWLDNLGEDLVIYYKLKSETRLPFTEEQKAVAKQIKNEVKSYKGVTHMYSTDNVSPNVEVTYLKDLESRLVALENAMLGGN